jgi:hypothetical protein
MPKYIKEGRRVQWTSLTHGTRTARIETVSPNGKVLTLRLSGRPSPKFPDGTALALRHQVAVID